MPVPTINEDLEFEQIASGAAYSRTMTATESPTSWGLSGAPSGLTINSSGVISGTPTDTEATAYTMSVTATNGTGTSSAEEWLLVVLPAATGASQNGFGRPIDIDKVTGKVRIPGVTDWQPSGRPPSTGDADEESAICAWKEGDRFDLEIGVVQDGVLQAPTIDEVTVTIKEYEPELAITISEGTVTTSGSGTSRRYVVPVYLDPNDIEALLSNYEGDPYTAFTSRAEIVLYQENGASDYDSTLVEYSIPSTLDQGETHSNTFDINLDDQVNANYDLTLALVVPGDTSLEAEITAALTVTWDGATFAVTSGGGLQTASGSSTTPSDWDTTLELTSVTGDATGLQVDAEVTTTSQIANYRYDMPLQGGWTVGGFVTNEVVDPGGEDGYSDWEFYDSGDNLIYTLTPSGGDTALDIKSALDTGLGETTSVSLNDPNDEIEVVLPADTAVAYVYNSYSDTTLDTPTAIGGGPNYSNCKITCQVTGDPDLPGYEISSLAIPVEIARKLKEDAP